MQRVITASGKAFEVAWCGAGYDNVLRFDAKTNDMKKLIEVFTDSKETERIEYLLGSESTNVYEGYTTFNSISASQNGFIVGLNK